jgi:MFS family permease
VKIAALVRFAAAGWLAGTLVLLILTFAWPSIFPGFVHYNHYDPTGPAPNLGLIVLVVLAAAALPAIIGGVIGGRLPKEGGRTQQLLVAAIFGIFLALPCGCFGLWLFSGA